jgi:hypothetical protein
MKDGVVLAEEVAEVHSQTLELAQMFKAEVFKFMQSTGVVLDLCSDLLLQPHTIFFRRYGIDSKGVKPHHDSSLFTLIIPLWDEPITTMFHLRLGVDAMGMAGCVVPRLAPCVLSYLCVHDLCRNEEFYRDNEVRASLTSTRATLVFFYGRS